MHQLSGTFPREYGVSQSWRFFRLFVVCGLCFAGSIAAGALALWLIDQSFAVSEVLPLFLLPILLLPIGVVVALDTFLSKITLHKDAIEISNLNGTRRLESKDIAACRKDIARDSYMLVLKPSAEGTEMPFIIPRIIEMDGAFEAWLAAFPSRA